MAEMKLPDIKGMVLVGSLVTAIGTWVLFQEQITKWLGTWFATKEYVQQQVKMSECTIVDVISTTRYADKYERLETDILYLQDKMDIGVGGEADRRQLKRLESTMKGFEKQWQRIADKAGKCNLTAEDFEGQR